MEQKGCELGVDNHQKAPVQSKNARLGGPPTQLIVTIRDNRDYIRGLLCSYSTTSYSTTITGWGVLLIARTGAKKKKRSKVGQTSGHEDYTIPINNWTS